MSPPKWLIAYSKWRIRKNYSNNASEIITDTEQEGKFSYLTHPLNAPLQGSLNLPIRISFLNVVALVI